MNNSMNIHEHHDKEPLRLESVSTTNLRTHCVYTALGYQYRNRRTVNVHEIRCHVHEMFTISSQKSSSRDLRKVNK